jgi:hypothetical protein
MLQMYARALPAVMTAPTAAATMKTPQAAAAAAARGVTAVMMAPANVTTLARLQVLQLMLVLALLPRQQQPCLLW